MHDKYDLFSLSVVCKSLSSSVKKHYRSESGFMSKEENDQSATVKTIKLFISFDHFKLKTKEYGLNENSTDSESKCQFSILKIAFTRLISTTPRERSKYSIDYISVNMWVQVMIFFRNYINDNNNLKWTYCPFRGLIIPYDSHVSINFTVKQMYL